MSPKVKLNAMQEPKQKIKVAMDTVKSDNWIDVVGGEAVLDRVLLLLFP